MKTEIIAIIDRSGSMQLIANDAIGGFNTFLEDQKTVPGEARMSVVLFDHEYTPLYSGKSLESSESLTQQTFIPRGSTALMDAIGRTLNEHGARIKADNWAEKVIVCILTDGGENASKEFTQPKIKEMIEHAEKLDGHLFFWRQIRMPFKLALDMAYLGQQQQILQPQVMVFRKHMQQQVPSHAV